MQFSTLRGGQSCAVPPVMRICLLALCVGSLCQAETAFQYLTPNYDGSAVWFSSRLRMKGTDQYAHLKIFRWDDTNGVQLYEQKASLIPESPGFESSNAYNLFSVSVSADGATVAVNGVLDCNFIGCRFVETSRSEIRRGSAEILNLNEAASLSPNGRFAYLTSSINLGQPYNMDGLRDLASGQEVFFAGDDGLITFPSALPYRHRVANDGTVTVAVDEQPPFGRNANYLRSWPSGELRRLPADAGAAMINDSATRLVYVGSGGLVAYDIPASRETLLAQGGGSFLFDISNDGAVIAYGGGGQAWIVRSDGSGKRQVASTADSIVELALSGDGNVLFAMTATSGILRIDLRTSISREIVPTASVMTPSVLGGFGHTTAGGLLEFVAQSLPEIAEVRLLGQPQQIVSQAGGDLLTQTPFDMVAGTGWAELVLRQQTEGPFVSSVLWGLPIRVSGFEPFWYAVDRSIAALHEDFSAVVSPGESCSTRRDPACIRIGVRARLSHAGARQTGERQSAFSRG